MQARLRLKLGNCLHSFRTLLLFDAGCNYGDGNLILCIFIVHCTEDDVGILSYQLFHIGSRIICLNQADVSGDIDDNIRSTFDCALQKRRRNGSLHSFNSLVITLCSTDTHMGNTLVLHDRGNIRKVQVNQSGHVNQIRNSLNGLLQNLIRLLQSIRKRSFLLYNFKQSVVRNHN